MQQAVSFFILKNVTDALSGSFIKCKKFLTGALTDSRG